MGWLTVNVDRNRIISSRYFNMLKHVKECEYRLVAVSS